MIERLNIQPVSVIVHMDRYLIGPENLSLNAKEEFAELCRSSGSSIGAEVFGKIDKPTSKYFIKQGKAEEIKKTVKELSADLVIFNNSLTPSQERNLEKLPLLYGVGNPRLSKRAEADERGDTYKLMKK